MPELPEVEVIAKSLQPVLEKKILTDFWTSNKPLRSQLSKKDCQALKNKRVLKVFRRAKYLVLDLKNSWLLIHFGMTGKIIVSDEQKDTFLNSNKHIHFIFKAGLNYVYYQDTRRFGGIFYIKKKNNKADIDTQSPFKFGIEPLSEHFDTNYLYLKSRNINQSIKSWLMTGFPVAGIGNIYASEALFRAGINPFAKPQNLGRVRISRLVFAIKYVLTEAINSGGSTIKDYSSTNSEPGKYSENHLVYGKKNHRCLVCLNILSIKNISQRSSFYCLRCQKK